MAYVDLPGFPIAWGKPAFHVSAVNPALAATTAIDATGEKLAFCGYVWWPGATAGATKDIQRVGFRFGTVTKSGGSAMTVSLQNVSTAAGAAMQPDGTPDETVAIANADAGFVSNVWYRTGTFSADRTVTYNDKLAVVLEYDGSGRLSTDTVQLSGITNSGVIGLAHNISTVFYDGGAWSTTSTTIQPNIILEFDDGTFGTFVSAFPCSALTVLTFNSGSATDEYALSMEFPCPVKIRGVEGAWSQSGTSATFDFVAYEGTSAITNGTISVHPRHNTASTSGDNGYAQFPGELTLAAGTTYYLAVKPDTTNNVSLYYFDVADANHLTCHPMGVDWVINSRVNGGAWAGVTATRRPFLWPLVSAVDDGAGGGGGAVVGSAFGGTVIR